MDQHRVGNTFLIKFEAGATESQIITLSNGYFGTFLVPTGSETITKTIQFIAVDESDTVTKHLDTALLSTAKTLAAGANALSAAEVYEAGAAQQVRFRLNSSVSAAANIWLLWKS